VYRWAGRMMLDAAKVRRRTRLVRRFEFPLRVKRNGQQTASRIMVQP